MKRREVALRQRSKKRASEQVWYSALRFAFLRIDGDQRRCERCAEPATEVHHMRGRTGADYLDVSLWAALCHDCHAWVTEHPREAIAAGLSLPRTHRRTA